MRHDEARTIRHRSDQRHIADAGRFHIGGGQHREDARDRPRSGAVDRTDIGEGMRGADEDAVSFARCPRVIGKASRAGQEPGILVARREWPVHRLPPPITCVMLTSLTALANAGLMRWLLDRRC